MLTRQAFWFIRHGQTDWNRSGRCQGRADVPLSMQGEAEAAAAIPHLEGRGINAICASPLKRARRTAEIIGQGLGLPVVEVAGLEEMDVGRTGRRKVALLRIVRPFPVRDVVDELR